MLGRTDEATVVGKHIHSCSIHRQKVPAGEQKTCLQAGKEQATTVFHSRYRIHYTDSDCIHLTCIKWCCVFMQKKQCYLSSLYRLRLHSLDMYQMVLCLYAKKQCYLSSLYRLRLHSLDMYQMVLCLYAKKQCYLSSLYRLRLHSLDMYQMVLCLYAKKQCYLSTQQSHEFT